MHFCNRLVNTGRPIVNLTLNGVCLLFSIYFVTVKVSWWIRNKIYHFVMLRFIIRRINTSDWRNGWSSLVVNQLCTITTTSSVAYSCVCNDMFVMLRRNVNVNFYAVQQISAYWLTQRCMLVLRHGCDVADIVTYSRSCRTYRFCFSPNIATNIYLRCANWNFGEMNLVLENNDNNVLRHVRMLSKITTIVKERTWKLSFCICFIKIETASTEMCKSFHYFFLLYFIQQQFS
jgi:hypothetical protein